MLPNIRSTMIKPVRSIYSDAEELRRLRALNEELKERVRQLEANDEFIVFPAAWRLTKTEKRVLDVMSKRTDPISRERLWDIIYGGLSDEKMAHPNIFAVYIHRLRQKLKKFGIEFKTEWGSGYVLTPASRQLVLQMRGIE